ncbi:DUF4190 domain-containing protein [Micromonospora yangpuensis]|uniref:DUF4190 domain-containing protein n=1 Tax=Micromonospora yangpuensis TaxID=683228 RepID=A0A1C6U576_9ACTN|nr:DUF4190 domain-containing protein [Micromonospora yangpuensis]GGL92304.1 hypothetical protein GCM10012279_07450 [Micromonospora yangpuensis]SCL49061.1 protein of unknown function [Micromonospora yangpuensis]
MSQPPSSDQPDPWHPASDQPPSPYEQPASSYEQPPSPYEQPGRPGGEPPSQWAEPGRAGAGSGPQWGGPQQWGQQQSAYPPQAPYGQYGPPPGAGANRGTNVPAILSLVFAFVFAPAGIVLGHVAKRQIRRTGEDGEQLASWGLILSYVFTALYVLGCVGWIALVIWAGTDSGTGSYR